MGNNYLLHHLRWVIFWFVAVSWLVGILHRWFDSRTIPGIPQLGNVQQPIGYCDQWFPPARRFAWGHPFEQEGWLRFLHRSLGWSSIVLQVYHPHHPMIPLPEEYGSHDYVLLSRETTHRWRQDSYPLSDPQARCNRFPDRGILAAVCSDSNSDPRKRL